MLDLKYAYSQLRLAADTAKQYNFNISGERLPRHTGSSHEFMVCRTCQPNFKRLWIELLTTYRILCASWMIILVCQRVMKQHEKLVETVLKNVEDKNLAWKISKGEFFKHHVDWLGHQLLESGVRPKFTKTEAIENVKPPKSLKQLRSFLGSINHLEKLIPDVKFNRTFTSTS